MRYIDHGELRGWIIDRTGIDGDVIDVVLAVELEYLWRVRIVEGPDPGTSYYATTDLVGASTTVVDNDDVADDVERLAGIEKALALDVFAAEIEWVT